MPFASASKPSAGEHFMPATRVLSTSLLVGPSLKALGEKFPLLSILPYRSEAWLREMESAEALIVLLSEPLGAEDVARCPNLKAIGTYSVGTNHLPVDLCEARGISIINTPDVLTDATADLALALLLAVARRIAEGEAMVRSGEWEGWQPSQLLGIGLSGKTCGILGSGPIGRAFARRVWSLGMTPIFWTGMGWAAQWISCPMAEKQLQAHQPCACRWTGYSAGQMSYRCTAH
jgi:lactate dehydrogenase-like 2-hydroxyacid dehydrogenase